MSKFNVTSIDVYNWCKGVGLEHAECIKNVGTATLILENNISLVTDHPVALCARFFNLDIFNQIKLNHNFDQGSKNIITRQALHNDLYCDELITYFKENNMLGSIMKDLTTEQAKRRAFQYGIEFGVTNMKQRYEEELIMLDELRTLRAENAKLRVENEELKLRPPERGGPAFEAAEERFNEAKRKRQ